MIINLFLVHEMVYKIKLKIYKCTGSLMGLMALETLKAGMVGTGK